jgi:hypothetical protein
MKSEKGFQRLSWYRNTILQNKLTDPAVPSCSVDMCVANCGIMELYCTELGSADVGII